MTKIEDPLQGGADSLMCVWYLGEDTGWVPGAGWKFQNKLLNFLKPWFFSDKSGKRPFQADRRARAREEGTKQGTLEETASYFKEGHKELRGTSRQVAWVQVMQGARTAPAFLHLLT